MDRIDEIVEMYLCYQSFLSYASTPLLATAALDTRTMKTQISLQIVQAGLSLLSSSVTCGPIDEKVSEKLTPKNVQFCNDNVRCQCLLLSVFVFHVTTSRCMNSFTFISEQESERIRAP